MKIPHYIGETESGRKVELPKDAATQGFAVLGKRGRGKSNLAGVILEQFAAHSIPFVVFDPPSAHWGIRFAADADGKPSGPSGFDVLLIGGDHGDVPLDPTGGKELAALIVETNLSCVIDMKAMTYTGLQRFYADFSEELFRLNRTVRFLLFEEAQNVAPQMLKFEEQKRALYATEKLIDEGRGIGLGFALVSQRPAAINKSVLTQVDNLLALGMFAPQDIDQVEDWFKHQVSGENRKEREENLRRIVSDIAGMGRGECWFLSPEAKEKMIKFHVRQRLTYHAGRTPKPGESPVNVAKFTVTDAVRKLRSLFDAKKSERHQDAQTLADANRRIRELEKKIKSAPTATREVSVADPKAIERAVRQVEQGFRSQIGQLETRLKAMQRILTGIATTAKNAVELKMEIKPFVMPKVSTGEIQQRGYVQESARADAHHPRSNESNGNLTGPERKILEALVRLDMIGKSQPVREMAAAWAGYSAQGGAFGNPAGHLNVIGLIRYPSPGIIEITDEGRAAMGSVAELNSAQVREKILGTCTGPERKILTALMEHGPEEISKADLAERSGYAPVGGAFGNPIGALRTKGLLDYPRPGFVKAADWLFLE